MITYIKESTAGYQAFLVLKISLNKPNGIIKEALRVDGYKYELKHARGVCDGIITKAV